MKNNKFTDERRTGIGGSDVASCFNLDRGCARKLVYEKRGTTPDYPDPYRPEYERGKDLEPVAREKYQRETGKQVWNAGEIRRSAKYPHMLCHIDGEIDGKRLGIEEDGTEILDAGLLEIKVLNKWNLNRIKKAGLPEGYVLQNQHGMYVGGYDWAEWALLCPDPWELFVIPCSRDESLIKTIIEQEEQIWKQVTNGPMPDKLDPKDARCQTCPFRKQCQGSEIQTIIPQEQRGIELPDDSSLDSLAAEVWEAQELRDQATTLYEEARDRMTKAIGERPGVKVTGGRFILTRSTPVRWDTKALQASIPLFPLLEDFKKPGSPQVTLKGYRA